MHTDEVFASSQTFCPIPGCLWILIISLVK